MGLQEYKNKRNFKVSPEPYVKQNKITKDKSLIFVVQKHQASHLHYDFRLQIGNVLKSWAIPKVPTNDAQISRLAINVEDHPLDYADFEGKIPKGNYGAGLVEIWDSGYWIPQSKAYADYKKGRLKFELKGKRLKGKWLLVRLKDNKNWLLKKLDKK
jgi:bifunctional non-homologous end joining protein LigD